MRFTKEYLNKEQVEKLLVIANSNLKKGVKLHDENLRPFGNAYSDWHKYNLEKKDKKSLKETTQIALDQFSTPPDLVIEFGSGTGSETLGLLEHGCKKVIAIDGDHEAISILRSRLSEKWGENFEVYEGPFLTFNPEEPADLFLASYTWPYRPPNDFTECWSKTCACVKMGGIIAGHFFGQPENIDPAMTYHTKDYLQELLLQSFEIISFDVEEKNSRKIFGGNQPPWGHLYHVVAKKIKDPHQD